MLPGYKLLSRTQSSPFLVAASAVASEIEKCFSTPKIIHPWGIRFDGKPYAAHTRKRFRLPVPYPPALIDISEILCGALLLALHRHTYDRLSRRAMCARWWRWKRSRYLHRVSQHKKPESTRVSRDYDCLNIDLAQFFRVKFVYALHFFSSLSLPRSFSPFNRLLLKWQSIGARWMREWMLKRAYSTAINSFSNVWNVRRRRLSFNESCFCEAVEGEKSENLHESEFMEWKTSFRF